MTPEELLEIEDNSIMSWGKFKGRQMKDLPVDYLLWFNEQEWSNDQPFTKQYVCKRINILTAKYRREHRKNYVSRRLVPPLVPVEVLPLPNIPIGNGGMGGTGGTVSITLPSNLTPGTRVTINNRDEVIPYIAQYNGPPIGVVLDTDNDMGAIDVNLINNLIANAHKERIVIIPDKVKLKNVLIEDERAIEL